MSTDRYPEETIDNYNDNGTMPDNVATVRDAVVGRRIVSAEYQDIPTENRYWASGKPFVITLDDGTQVRLRDTSDCCAYTDLEGFFLDPQSVDHVILGVGTTDEFSTWHVYADYGDILRLQVNWSAGNPFYYGYGFDIDVVPL